MDEDELAEAHKQSLQAHADYDTFGSTAAEQARRLAAATTAQRPSAIPNLLPDEVIAPVAESIGRERPWFALLLESASQNACMTAVFKVRQLVSDWSNATGYGPCLKYTVI